MLRDYLREEKLPLFWCPGCGNGVVHQAILRNMDAHNLAPENTVVVTGIGCWGKADDYIKTSTFHGTHGRALAFATGIKLANPKLNVITLIGDGDGITIGGNHLIHAARRNIDLTVVMVNNLNYGMTGGQYSGTTPKHYFTKTSPYGHVENGFDVCKMVTAAGAPFVARATVYDVGQLYNYIGKAFEHNGFSFVEVISPCPTHFGRSNNMSSATKMLTWIKEHSISIDRASDISESELEGKFVTGIFANYIKEDYGTAYARICSNMKGVSADV